MKAVDFPRRAARAAAAYELVHTQWSLAALRCPLLEPYYVIAESAVDARHQWGDQGCDVEGVGEVALMLYSDNRSLFLSKLFYTTSGCQSL